MSISHSLLSQSIFLIHSLLHLCLFWNHRYLTMAISHLLFFLLASSLSFLSHYFLFCLSAIHWPFVDARIYVVWMFLSQKFLPLPRCLFLTHCSLRAYFSLTLPSFCIYFLNHQNFSPPYPPSLLSSLCPVSHSLLSLSLCPHLTHNSLSSCLYSSLISLCLSPSLLSLTLSINTSHGLCHYFYLMSTFPDR